MPKVKIIMVTQTLQEGHSIESGKPLGLIRNVARVELNALDLDMTKVKVDGSQKYKSGTIKFVP